jgi:ribose-phosphate pyrophosphokinase
LRDIAVFRGSAPGADRRDLRAPHRAAAAGDAQAVANDCLEVQLQSNCRERDVFLIQPLVPPVQENLVELLLMADAAAGASAAR